MLTCCQGQLKEKLRNLRHDSGQMEDFSIKVREVSHGEDEERFKNLRMICESSHETYHVTPDDADDGSTSGHNDETGHAFEHVRHLQVLFAQVDVSVKHVV